MLVNIEGMGRREREAYLQSLPVEQRVDAVFAYEKRPITRRPEQVGVMVWNEKRQQHLCQNLNDRCQFPECNKPARTRTDRGGYDSLCQGHARQWSRHHRLVPLRVYAK